MDSITEDAIWRLLYDAAWDCEVHRFSVNQLRALIGKLHEHLETLEEANVGYEEEEL